MLLIHRASYKNNDAERNVEVENGQHFKFTIYPQTQSGTLQNSFFFFLLIVEFSSNLKVISIKRKYY